MPELPEVEVIKLGLQKKLVGLTIKKIEVLSPKTFQGEVEQVEGKRVVGIWRRAKILGIDLSGNVLILFHLKMSGQLILIQSEERFVGGHPTADMVGPMPNSHTRVIFTFSDNSKLYFNDQRRFGWIRVVENGKCLPAGKAGKMENFLGDLGPEPLDKSFTWQVLKQNLLKRKSMPVKVAIMDQKVVAGVGNIYANEACFDAGIDPRTKMSALTDNQFIKLHQGIIKSLKDGIKYGGATRAHFVNAQGQKGYFLDYAFVYGKDKQKCKKCSFVIKKIQLAGRGTYLCERCQKI